MEAVILPNASIVIKDDSYFIPITVSNNTVIVEVDSQLTPITVSARGPRGYKGDQGDQGIPGAAGSNHSRYTADEIISGNAIVAFNSSGNIVLADCSIMEHAHIAGMSVFATVQYYPAEITSSGIVTHLGWTWTPGAFIYLGHNGALTETVPSDALFTKVIGVALSPTIINIDIQPAIFLT